MGLVPWWAQNRRDKPEKKGVKMTSESEAVPHKRQSGQFGVGEFLHSSRLRGRTPHSLETKGREAGGRPVLASGGRRGQAGGLPGEVRV